MCTPTEWLLVFVYFGALIGVAVLLDGIGKLL